MFQQRGGQGKIGCGLQVVQLPGGFLGIFRIKESKQLLVGELKQTRGVICHAIREAREVTKLVEISVSSLVNARLAQKVGCGALGGCRAFGAPGHGGSVVATGPNGALPAVKGMDCYIGVADGAGQFKVAVGHCAQRVVKGHNLFLDGGRKRLSPDYG